MNRGAITAAAVVFTTAGLVAALTIPALAGPRPGPTVEAAAAAGVSPQMIEALARDLKLDTKGVQVRLANEAKASRADLSLRKTLGGTYAGSWLSADATTHHVAVTDAKTAGQVTAAGSQAKVVQHGLAKLEAAMARLAQAPNGVPGWYLDVPSNSVVVLVHAGALDAAKAWVKRSGADPAVVRYETSKEDPKPFIDVIGGNAYYIGGGTRCSIGFSVAGGFVTAGHCGRTGATTSQPSGTFRGSSFPGNDYGWVQVSSGNTPRPLVNRYSGGQTVTVGGSTDAPVGSSVCRSGSTTGWHCGTISARNASVTYPQGTVSGLIRTSVCAEPGDSGGSLLAGSQAQGVTSGGSGNCRSGGTTYFQPVNEILQVYGLQLLTGGGPPPTTGPPPGGCGNHEYTKSGTLSSGGSQYQPDGRYYYSGSSGAHRANLCGPSGTDFDVYLQKWTGRSWAVVAQGITPGNNESINYSGTAGYYRYRVHAYSGSGSYTLGYSNP